MEYHIVANGKAAGPYTLEQLMSMGISGETLVWYKGLANWVAASTVPEIDAALRGVNIPPMRQEEVVSENEEVQDEVEAVVVAVQEESEAAEQTNEDNVIESVEDEPISEPEQPAEEVVEPQTFQPVEHREQEQSVQSERPIQPIPPVRPVQPYPNYEPMSPEAPQEPSNNLGLAIVALVLFPPLGIPALIKACYIKQLWNEGKYDLAEAQSKTVRKLGIWSIVLMAILYGLMMCTSVVSNF